MGAPTSVGAAPTVNITLGQTIDQVTAALGPPVTIVDLGTKKIYKYKDMKITGFAQSFCKKDNCAFVAGPDKLARGMNPRAVV